MYPTTQYLQPQIKPLPPSSLTLTEARDSIKLAKIKNVIKKAKEIKIILGEDCQNKLQFLEKVQDASNSTSSLGIRSVDDRTILSFFQKDLPYFLKKANNLQHVFISMEDASKIGKQFRKYCKNSESLAIRVGESFSYFRTLISYLQEGSQALYSFFQTYNSILKNIIPATKNLAIFGCQYEEQPYTFCPPNYFLPKENMLKQYFGTKKSMPTQRMQRYFSNQKIIEKITEGQSEFLIPLYSQPKVPYQIRKQLLIEALIQIAQRDNEGLNSGFSLAESLFRFRVVLPINFHTNFLFSFPCQEGNIEWAKYLIAEGVSVNSQGFRNTTPLIYAAKDGQLELLKLFVSHGADLDLKDENGFTALQHAVEYGNTDCAKYLIECSVKPNWSKGELLLIQATKKENLELVKFLVDKGVDINGRDHRKVNAWYYAQKYGFKDIEEFLCQQGADTGVQEPEEEEGGNDCLDDDY